MDAPASKTNRSLLFVVRALLWLLLSYLFIDKKNWLADHAIVSNLLSGIYTILSVSIIVSIGRFTILALYRRRNPDLLERNNFVLGISRIGNILNAVFLVIGIMLMLGINPKEFLTSITIVAMAIALLFREYITNMISGLLIMFSKQYSLGDLIQWGNHQGEIIDITLANIVVKNDDDDTILIPNNLVFTSAFINRSTQSSTKWSLRFTLPLNAIPGNTVLEQALRIAAERFNRFVYPETFYVKITGIEQEYVHYKVGLVFRENIRIKMKELEHALFQAILHCKNETAPKHS